MPLDPQAEKFLLDLKKLKVPSLREISIAEARAQVLPASKPLEPVAKIEDREIDGPNGPVPVRIYTPEAHHKSDEHSGWPMLVFFHGGGWVLCDINAYDGLCRKLANAGGCVVVSVGYRLSPEHKFPVAVNDCFAATRWACENAAEFHADANRVAVGGDSAGGNLAAVVSLMARDKGGPPLAFQVLIYPATDYSFETPSYQDNAEGYLLTKDSMMWFWEQYLAGENDGHNPYVSPLRAESLAGLPAAFVMTAEYDPLRDEGETYSRKLQEAGCRVTRHRCDGMIHGFLRRTNIFDRADEMIERIGQELRAALGGVGHCDI